MNCAMNLTTIEAVFRAHWHWHLTLTVPGWSESWQGYLACMHEFIITVVQERLLVPRSINLIPTFVPRKSLSTHDPRSSHVHFSRPAIIMCKSGEIPQPAPNESNLTEQSNATHPQKTRTRGFGDSPRKEQAHLTRRTTRIG